jgi:hypothetical protein
MFKLIVLAAIAAVVYGALNVRTDFVDLRADRSARIERVSNY